MFQAIEGEQMKIDEYSKLSRNLRWGEKRKKTPVTKKARKAVCIRIAAHSCLTTMKSFGGARTTAATAALKASATEEQSDPSDAALRPPLILFQDP